VPIPSSPSAPTDLPIELPTAIVKPLLVPILPVTTIPGPFHLYWRPVDTSSHTPAFCFFFPFSIFFYTTLKQLSALRTPACMDMRPPACFSLLTHPPSSFICTRTCVLPTCPFQPCTTRFRPVHLQVTYLPTLQHLHAHRHSRSHYTSWL
jgi:hypothetical protein